MEQKHIFLRMVCWHKIRLSYLFKTISTWDQVMSVVVKPFHVKDTQTEIYLAADPKLKICCSRDPPPEGKTKHINLKNTT